MNVKKKPLMRTRLIFFVDLEKKVAVRDECVYEFESKYIFRYSKIP